MFAISLYRKYHVFIFKLYRKNRFVEAIKNEYVFGTIGQIIFQIVVLFD